ncbi:hypothetical protein AAG906_018989 [Vitis piasezkii]
MVTRLMETLILPKPYLKFGEMLVASTVMILDGTYALGFKAEASWIAFQQIDQFILSGGGVLMAKEKPYGTKKCPSSAYCNQLPINLRFNFITNSMVKEINSRDNKQFHINLLGCGNFTFYNFAISAPEDNLNTDGIHIGRSSGIDITDSTIETGDDCVSIGDGRSKLISKE